MWLGQSCSERSNPERASQPTYPHHVQSACSLTQHAPAPLPEKSYTSSRSCL
jgi:hypothetical protein